MKQLFELWVNAVEELIEAERFWSAAVVAMGGTFAAVIAVVGFLILILKAFGLVGYVLFTLGAGLWWTQRSMRKHHEAKYLDDDDENETGVS